MEWNVILIIIINTILYSVCVRSEEEYKLDYLPKKKKKSTN